MKYPQLVVCGFDDWIANQLRELASETRWLLNDVRLTTAIAGHLEALRPTVLLLQADPTSPKLDVLETLAEVHRRSPDVPIVVLSDAKLPDELRANWTASVLDLGACCVLFPPYTRLLLEDLVTGLMTATIRRTIGEPVPTPNVAPKSTTEETIDLAEGHYEEPS